MYSFLFIAIFLFPWLMWCYPGFRHTQTSARIIAILVRCKMINRRAYFGVSRLLFHFTCEHYFCYICAGLRNKVKTFNTHVRLLTDFTHIVLVRAICFCAFWTGISCKLVGYIYCIIFYFELRFWIPFLLGHRILLPSH